MSSLEYIFLGDLSWQTQRIASSVDSLRRDQALQNAGILRALDRIGQLQEEQLSIGRQRLRLLEQQHDENTRRRSVTGALVLHEAELDRLLAARETLKDSETPGSSANGHQQLAEFARSIDADLAMKARSIGLAVSLSGISISDLSDITEQRQFTAILQKADTEWVQFSRTRDQATIDKVELAAVAALCETQIGYNAFLACAYTVIANEPAFARCFDGSIEAQAQAAERGSTVGDLAIGASKGVGHFAGGLIGVAAALAVSGAIMRRGGWDVIAGAAALFVLVPFGWLAGAALGESLGKGASEATVGGARQTRVDELKTALSDGVGRAVVAAATRFTETVGARLQIFDVSAHQEYLAQMAPRHLTVLREQVAEFWMDLTTASPAIRRLNPFDSEQKLPRFNGAVDVLVAVAHAREAYSR